MIKVNFVEGNKTYAVADINKKDRIKLENYILDVGTIYKFESKLENGARFGMNILLTDLLTDNCMVPCSKKQFEALEVAIAKLNKVLKAYKTRGELYGNGCE